jgi:hypothetical protein
MNALLTLPPTSALSFVMPNAGAPAGLQLGQLQQPAGAPAVPVPLGAAPRPLSLGAVPPMDQFAAGGTPQELKQLFTMANQMPTGAAPVSPTAPAISGLSALPAGQVAMIEGADLGANGALHPPSHRTIVLPSQMQDTSEDKLGKLLAKLEEAELALDEEKKADQSRLIKDLEARIKELESASDTSKPEATTTSDSKPKNVTGEESTNPVNPTVAEKEEAATK